MRSFAKKVFGSIFTGTFSGFGLKAGRASTECSGTVDGAGGRLFDAAVCVDRLAGEEERGPGETEVDARLPARLARRDRRASPLSTARVAASDAIDSSSDSAPSDRYAASSAPPLVRSAGSFTLAMRSHHAGSCLHLVS